jgi:hypothetical protein
MRTAGRVGMVVGMLAASFAGGLTWQWLSGQGGVAVAQGGPVQEIVRARGFVLVDGQERERARLAVSPEGKVRLSALDASGKERFAAGETTEAGTWELLLHDDAQGSFAVTAGPQGITQRLRANGCRTAVQMGSRRDSAESGLAFMGATDDEVRGDFGTIEDGCGLNMNYPDGTHAIGMGADLEGAGVDLFCLSGKQGMSLAATGAGGGWGAYWPSGVLAVGCGGGEEGCGLTFHDQAETERFGIGMPTFAGVGLVMKDKDGQEVWRLDEGAVR